MSIKIKARAIREIFHRDNYWIIAFIPTESNRDIKLNKYGNFSCCGDIGYISINKDYELELEEGKASKYGMSYNILSVPSMQMEDLSKLSYDSELDHNIVIDLERFLLKRQPKCEACIHCQKEGSFCGYCAPYCDCTDNHIEINNNYATHCDKYEFNEKYLTEFYN